MTSEPSSLDRLLPHTSRARLLTRLVERRDDAVIAEALVPSGYPLVESGGVPAFVGIELGAQAVAALLACGAPSAAEPPAHGYVVRVREADFTCPYLPVGVPITVAATIEASAGALVHARVVVSVAGTPCVTASLSTYLPPGAPRP